MGIGQKVVFQPKKRLFSLCELVLEMKTCDELRFWKTSTLLMASP